MQLGKIPIVAIHVRVVRKTGTAQTANLQPLESQDVTLLLVNNRRNAFESSSPFGVNLPLIGLADSMGVWLLPMAAGFWVW